MIKRMYLHEGHDHGADGHHHDHSHGADSPEERLVLLKYMADHNAHHAEELHDLAHGTDGEASELIHAAVHDLEDSTEKLRKAIELLSK